MFPMNRHITRKTSTMASIRVLTTSLMATLMNGVVSIGINHLHPVREIAAHFLHLVLDGIGGFQGIGAGDLAYGHARCGAPVVVGLDVVRFRPNLGPSYVLRRDDRSRPGSCGWGCRRIPPAS